MNVTALKIGSVFINLSTGFEEQGFAVTEVTDSLTMENTKWASPVALT